MIQNPDARFNNAARGEARPSWKSSSKISAVSLGYSNFNCLSGHFMVCSPFCNVFLSALLSKNRTLPTACTLSFHRIGIFMSGTMCHKLLLLRAVMMNYKHLGCIMDTPHYQDKHDSLCILAVKLNRRAAHQTRPTDAEQQRTVSLPPKSRDCTRSLRDAARLSCAAITAASNPSDHLSRLLLFTRKASRSNLSSAVNQPLTVSSGWVKLPLLREEAFFLLFPPHDIMSHGGKSVQMGFVLQVCYIYILFG